LYYRTPFIRNFIQKTRFRFESFVRMMFTAAVLIFFSLYAQNAKYAVAGNWIFGTRGIRQIDKQACQPDSLLARIKYRRYTKFFE
ncbi:MAG: hypothetical protein IJV50_02285, partial [Lachnospiraceae bacterium]|nr:hypothetical protein [Lachnospiraceae bacterium]